MKFSSISIIKIILRILNSIHRFFYIEQYTFNISQLIVISQSL